MESRPYIRIVVSAVAIRSSSSTEQAPTVIPIECRVKLKGFPAQASTLIPLASPSSTKPSPEGVVASFYVDESALKKLLPTSCLRPAQPPCLNITAEVEPGCHPLRHSLGLLRHKTRGSISVPIGELWAGPIPGWFSIGSGVAEIHVRVRAEAEPRYVFLFEGRPELGPQILQIHRKLSQPIFSCTFTRSGSPNAAKERKGWIVLIHDLSGSKVAAASMVTPFVPTAGLERVTKSNPGAWLILRPGPLGGDAWRPWGRLEAWREKGRQGAQIGLRFHHYGKSPLISESAISTRRGGSFNVVARNGGLAMTASVHGRKDATAGSKQLLQVQLAVKQVSCLEDAAAFMALAAAANLSMDACLPFNRELPKTFLSSESSAVS